MLNSDYINRFYAYNALNYYFNDEDEVVKYVLPNLSEQDQ